MQPLVQVADRQIALGRAQIQVQRGATLPTISADAAYGMDTVTVPRTGDLGWQGAVTLSMPIFGFGAHKDRIAAYGALPCRKKGNLPNMTLPFRSARPHHAQRYLVLLLSFLWISSAWAVPVTVAIVKTSTWTQTVSVMGQVKSVGQVTLTAPMTGRVIGPFQPAGMLSPGAVIARIGPPGLQARIQAAQAQTDYARIALQRDQRLLRDGVVAIATVDSSRVAWQQANATSRALQAEQSDQSLIAPFAGSIDYLVAPGAVVMAGTPIATLSGRGQPWVASLVPPQTAFHLTVGVTRPSAGRPLAGYWANPQHRKQRAPVWPRLRCDHLACEYTVATRRMDFRTSPSPEKTGRGSACRCRGDARRSCTGLCG